MSEYEQITLDVEAHVATLTLNRPEALNAFTVQMLQEMVAAFDQIDADDDIRAVIVTGAGRGFCAGADMSSGGGTFAGEPKPDASEEAARASRDGGGILTLRIFECLKPVIAAINGPAVGVGATMTLPMDIRLAATNAKFGFVFARRGIVPEAASSWFLPRVVGISRALEWSMSGRVFLADEALEGGLVRSVHEPEDLLGAARAIALDIAENAAPVSVALARQMMWKMLTADHPMEAHKLDSRLVPARGSHPDGPEGVMSFLEKRPPEFRGSVSSEMPEEYPWWSDRVFE